MLKKILLGVLVIVLAGVGGPVYIAKNMSVDHDAAEYRARLEYIWADVIPYQPTPAEKTEVEASKGVLIRLAQWLLHTPADKPALVAYPLLKESASPAVIIAPGGAYMGRAEKHEGEAIAQWLNSIGVSAFVLNYRLDRHPAPLSDAQRAIQYVRANAARFHIDPTRVGIMGFSAGGHLAATAGTHFLPGDSQAVDPVAQFSSRPDFMVLGYPVISFGEFAHTISRDMLVGPHPAPDLIENLSNEKQVTAETPPTFIWTAKTDAMVDYRNSQVFADALTQHGVPVEFHLFPEGSHGSGLAQKEKYANAWPDLCRQWLVKMGFIKP